MAKPITNDSTKKGKYNMDPEDHTPYSQITLKSSIILIVTTQVQSPNPEAAHLHTPSNHRRHLRHIGL
jgi:hypothetical protein